MRARHEALVRVVTREVLRRLADRERAAPTQERPPGSPAASSDASLAALIDHTLLRPDATSGMIRSLCEEAATFGFAAVCVNPVWVERCARWLGGTAVRVCTVVGFPLGANRTPIKTAEAERVRGLGAHEIDMVINIGALKSGDMETVGDDIRQVRRAVGSGATLKVILETALLSNAEKMQAARAAVAGAADFVKTSTGFGPGGATLDDVRLLADVVGTAARVKASGGIRDLDTARRMVEAGAARLGTSSGVAIAQAAVPRGSAVGRATRKPFATFHTSA